MSEGTKAKPTHHYGTHFHQHSSPILLFVSLDPQPSASLTTLPGRGGAGNVTSKETAVPKAATTAQTQSITTPTLKSKMYTTGRGGTGNMARNDFGEEARLAQDVDVPGITLPEGPAHTGRGRLCHSYQIVLKRGHDMNKMLISFRFCSFRRCGEQIPPNRTRTLGRKVE